MTFVWLACCTPRSCAVPSLSPSWSPRLLAIAEDALELIVVEIDTLPPCVDTKTAAANQSLLFEETDTNLALTYTTVLGDADAAFAAATTDEFHVRRERFDTQRHTATTMETRGLVGGVGQRDTEHLTVYGAAKVPFASRGMLAKQESVFLDFRPSTLSKAMSAVGSACAQVYPEDFLIPFAARHLNRPVTWISRREHLITCNHARNSTPNLNCHAGGTAPLWPFGARSTEHRRLYPLQRDDRSTQCRAVVLWTLSYPEHPYRIVDAGDQQTPSGTYRAPGRFEGDFFRERLFDIVADDLGIDPVAFRRRNLIAKDELPYNGRPHAGTAGGRARLRRLLLDAGSLSLGIRLGRKVEAYGS